MSQKLSSFILHPSSFILCKDGDLYMAIASTQKESPLAGGGTRSKVATTPVEDTIRRSQVAEVGTQVEPVQPEKTEPAVGVAVSLTCVSATKETVQTAPQSMPAVPVCGRSRRRC